MLPACTITFAATSVATPLAVSPEEGAKPGPAAAEGAPGIGPAPLFTTAVAAFRVAESQALNTSGGT
jgi:hypothetical protein